MNPVSQICIWLGGFLSHIIHKQFGISTDSRVPKVNTGLHTLRKTEHVPSVTFQQIVSKEVSLFCQADYFFTVKCQEK